MPRRIKVFGVPPSIAQVSVLPSSFFTSMWIHACGLTHSTFVIGPCSLTGAFASNSAENAWWAATEPVAATIAAIAAAAQIFRRIAPTSCLYLSGSITLDGNLALRQNSAATLRDARAGGRIPDF